MHRGNFSRRNPCLNPKGPPAHGDHPTPSRDPTLRMFSKLKKPKLNPMLLNVLLISFGIHLLALFILGGITVVRYVIPDEAEFDEPPPEREQQPPPDVKVEVKPQPKAQSQPLDNLRVKQVGQVAIDSVDVDLPEMNESFTVSSGMGGVAGGSLLGGASGRIGLGMSDINIFGLKTRAERVLFAVDASKRMLLDKKGGLNSYNRIKDEITSMVGNLSAGTLFNVAFYYRGKIKFFKDSPVPAGTEVLEELKQWIAPINKDIDSIGLSGTRKPPLKHLEDEPTHRALPTNNWRARNENLYLAQVFLEQPVDAVFVITGHHAGYQSVERPLTQKEKEAWQKKRSDPDYQEQLKEYKKQEQRLRKKARAKLKEINEKRAKRGIPPKVIRGNIVNALDLGSEREVSHPGRKPNPYIGQRDVEQYFAKLERVLRDERDGDAPSLNVVLFLAEDEKLSDSDEDQLDDFVRDFGGDHRIIRGLKQIKSQAEAAETMN